jgi:SAM-dependent methyltransferase
MNLKDKMLSFRSPDINNYPELKSYSAEEIYDNFIGCGGLYLATNMVRKMNLKKGDIILDLGCGFGTTSIFLAKMFDITVIAVDFWFPPTKMVEIINREGYSHRIVPLNLDITKDIPFANQYFNAIFSMNSLFLYGYNCNFLTKLLNTLKTGGTFCIGSECFNQEPHYPSITDVPREYNFDWKWNVWDTCFSKYHSPKWWRSLLSETNLLEITYCNELEDGVILFEDVALNYYKYFKDEILALGAMISQEKIVDTIIYGRENEIFPTLFVLSGTKKSEK